MRKTEFVCESYSQNSKLLHECRTLKASKGIFPLGVYIRSYVLGLGFLEKTHTHISSLSGENTHAKTPPFSHFSSLLISVPSLPLSRFYLSLANRQEPQKQPPPPSRTSTATIIFGNRRLRPPTTKRAPLPDSPARREPHTPTLIASNHRKPLPPP